MSHSGKLTDWLFFLSQRVEIVANVGVQLLVRVGGGGWWWWVVGGNEINTKLNSS